MDFRLFSSLDKGRDEGPASEIIQPNDLVLKRRCFKPPFLCVSHLNLVTLLNENTQKTRSHNQPKIRYTQVRSEGLLETCRVFISSDHKRALSALEQHKSTRWSHRFSGFCTLTRYHTVLHPNRGISAASDAEVQP